MIKWFQKANKKENGFALVVTLIFSALLLLLAGTLISFANTEITIAGYLSEDINIYYLAEAGIEIGYAVLALNFNHEEQVTVEFPNGNVTITFSEYLDGKIITSQAVGSDSRKTISILVNHDPDDVLMITAWLRP